MNSILGKLLGSVAVAKSDLFESEDKQSFDTNGSSSVNDFMLGTDQSDANKRSGMSLQGGESRNSSIVSSSLADKALADKKMSEPERMNPRADSSNNTFGQNATGSASMQHLHRLARLARLTTGAQSSVIFLPSSSIAHGSQLQHGEIMIEPKGWASELPALRPVAMTNFSGGLVSWVVQNAKPLHMSRFAHSSKVLGYYDREITVGSVVAVPIQVGQAAIGVLICDSDSPEGLTQLHGQLLSELAHQANALVELSNKPTEKTSVIDSSWHQFTDRSQQLIAALGISSVEVVRISLDNFDAIEATCGCSAARELYLQLGRLIEQSLPPPFPMTAHPTSGYLITVDNMMTSFHENRIIAIAQHLGGKKVSIKLSFARSGRVSARGSLDELVKLTNAQSMEEREYRNSRSTIR